MYVILYDVGPQEWEYVRVHLYVYVAMALRVHSLLNSKSRKHDHPLIRQIVVRERGMKCRVVTPIVGSLSYMSMFLNSMLLRVLGTDERLRPQSEDPAEDACSRISLEKGESLRSADLTRASDLIPHDLALQAARALSKGMGLSPFLSEVFELCVGPHTLYIPVKGLNGQSLTRWVTSTTRGLLMGSGTTWPILSLYNLWLWDAAWSRCRKEFRLRSPPTRWRRGRVRIVGDDLLGAGPTEVSKAYTDLMQRTGGSPSFGKDFLSAAYGVLVEQLVRVSPVSRGLSVLGSISVRSIQPSGRVVGGDPLPPWAAGPQLARAVDRVSGCYRLPVVGYIHKKYAAEIDRLRRQKIPPFLPREFGGGGFPSSLPLSVALGSLRPQWARALRCAMAQGEGSEVYLALLTAPWKLAYQEALVARDEVNFWTSAAQVALAASPQEADSFGDLRNPRAHELATLAIAFCSSTSRWLTTPKGARVRNLTVQRVRSEILRSVDRLNLLVPRGRLEDPVRALVTGLDSWLAKARRPVTRHAVLNLVNSSSSPLVDGTATIEADWLEEGTLDAYLWE